MPQPANKSLELAKRRKQVAALYLQGRYQWEIAEAAGVDPATICRDLKAIQAEWKASAVRDLDEAKAAELERIDNLERTHWQAWEASKDGGVGNPQFLTGVQWCITKRCDLLGLDAPKRQEVGGAGGEAIKLHVTRTGMADALGTEAAREILDRLSERLTAGPLTPPSPEANGTNGNGYAG